MTKHTYQIGHLAEWLCILRLTLTGWRIVARRWRCAQGEIDLIATRGDVLAFIEVKARRSLAAGMESISPQQRERITRAAQAYLARTPKAAGFSPRFDVMVLGIWPWPQRCCDAWQQS